jgi:hypothetical protein
MEDTTAFFRIGQGTTMSRYFERHVRIFKDFGFFILLCSIAWVPLLLVLLINWLGDVFFDHIPVGRLGILIMVLAGPAIWTGYRIYRFAWALSKFKRAGSRSEPFYVFDERGLTVEKQGSGQFYSWHELRTWSETDNWFVIFPEKAFSEHTEFSSKMPYFLVWKEKFSTREEEDSFRDLLFGRLG